MFISCKEKGEIECGRWYFCGENPEHMQDMNWRFEKAGGDVLAGECLEDARRCNALLLPGAGTWNPRRYGQDNTASWDLDPLRDREEFLLLELFTDLRRPVLGICRGMQTVNVFLGGITVSGYPGAPCSGRCGPLSSGAYSAVAAVGFVWGVSHRQQCPSPVSGPSGAGTAGSAMGAGRDCGGAGSYDSAGLGSTVASGASALWNGRNGRRQSAV